MSERVTWTVSGSITVPYQTDGTQGLTTYSFSASNPSPSTACGGWTPDTTASYTEVIGNGGNNLGLGTLTIMGTVHSGAQLHKTPTDLVASETTNAVGFGAGLYATIGQFRQLLNSSTGSSTIFNGRQVNEKAGAGSATDSCWFSGSLVPIYNHVTGSSWNVGYYSSLDNYWVDDYIGWNSSQVGYYQTHLPPGSSCTAQFDQVMSIGYGGISFSPYVTNTLQATINPVLNPVGTGVSITRAGVTQSTYYL
jgi:hypothetical protein